MNVGDWREVTLGDVCDSVSNTHPFEKAKLIFLNTSDVYDGSILHNNYSPVAEMPGQAKKSIKKGDILYSEIRPKNKRYAMVNFDASDYVVSTKFMVIRSNGLIVNKFLYLYLTSNEVLETLQQVAEARSGTFPQITFSQVAELKLNLPPIPEQKAIAATLSALDDMIELNNQINKTLEEMAQAIFKSWFVDFEPFRDGEFEESELGLIPKGWKVGTFGEVAEITSGKRPVSKQDKETPDFYVPLVGASCIMGYVNETLYNEPIIVIGRVGTHGIVQRFNTQCWPSDNTLVIKSNHYEFAYQILKGIDYRAFNRGSTQPLITQTDIKNYKIVIPDSYYLSRFEDTVKTLYKQYTVNNSESRLLERIRDMILPKLINGEIRVPVEEVV